MEALGLVLGVEHRPHGVGEDEVEVHVITPECETLLKLATAVVTKDLDRPSIQRDGSEPYVGLRHGPHRLMVHGDDGLDDLEFPDVHIRASPLQSEEFPTPHARREIQVVEGIVTVHAHAVEEEPDLFGTPELEVRAGNSRQRYADRDVLDDHALHLRIDEGL